MNWGYRIMLVYIAFVLAMLGMVYVSSRQTNEMQDENYYVKELAYQQVIDGKNNLQQLDEELSLTDSADMVKIRIPAAAAQNITDGKIYFLRPSDEKKDLHLALKPDAEGIQLIPGSLLSKGLYTVQLSWKSNNQLFYSEQSFNAQ
ncbi:MAG: FixH family protein [Sphingobacteriales bacterium]|jgi:nitrogen fixation protein FixH|nr:FixH family protein [Sphingobacteriales bacterium]